MNNYPSIGDIKVTPHEKFKEVDEFELLVLDGSRFDNKKYSELASIEGYFSLGGVSGYDLRQIVSSGIGGTSRDVSNYFNFDDQSMAYYDPWYSETYAKGMDKDNFYYTITNESAESHIAAHIDSEIFETVMDLSTYTSDSTSYANLSIEWVKDGTVLLKVYASSTADQKNSITYTYQGVASSITSRSIYSANAFFEYVNGQLIINSIQIGITKEELDECDEITITGNSMKRAGTQYKVEFRVGIRDKIYKVSDIDNLNNKIPYRVVADLTTSEETE